MECMRRHACEVVLRSATEYSAPLWDVTVRILATAPSGRELSVEAFWDGGQTWRGRFCPDEPGRWQWRSRCSDADNDGLHGREGVCRCVPGDDEQPLYARGCIELSPDRRHFVHADGTPFFWLADTAWNGAIRSEEEDWSRYLATRREQGFTVIQFVTTQWRGAAEDRGSRVAYREDGRLTIDPAWFQHIDGRVDAVNDHGLVAAPVVLWACTEEDPGRELSEENAVRLARYIVARWGAHQVVWILGGDGKYLGQATDRWLNIGRRVFGDRHDRLVAMHLGGQTWIADRIREEEWFDVLGYQSGHGASAEELQWLVSGQPATEWQKGRPCAVLNMEPNYEAHPAYRTGRKFTAADVRRAVWWSLLVTPIAGVTYGHNAIWPWPEEPEEPHGHEYLGLSGPWTEGLRAPGARSMSLVRAFFDPLPWQQLRPAPEILVSQPGRGDPARYIAAARTEDGRLAVIYTPRGDAIVLQPEALSMPARARWFDPRSGDWTDAGALNPENLQFLAPDDTDWVLLVQSEA